MPDSPSAVRPTPSHHALFWQLFCGTENNYSATKECASVQSQIMENISKLGLESKCLTPYHIAYCNDGWFTFYSDKQRKRERESEKKNLNRGHKPVVSKPPVFKLTKRNDAFRLNPKQEQVLKTPICPLAAIKHLKRGRQDTL